MTSEHRNNTVDTSILLWTEIPAEENVPSLNTTDKTDIPWDYEFSEDTVILIVTIIICLCGLVGNGIVIWLLGFRMKRNNFSVYILNLAIAEFIQLLNEILGSRVLFATHYYDLLWFSHILFLFSYSVELSLLMAISVEHCVSVLWPIWYKCHRPAHLSTIVCGDWILFLIISFTISLFEYIEIGGVFILCALYGLISLPIFLVLFVSNLILFIRIQCYSLQRKPSRVYRIILFNVLVFLLLGVPHGVYLVCMLAMESTFHYSEIFIFISFLSPINSAVNPIIYFFIGRQKRQQGGRRPFQEVLQRALTDENQEVERRRGRTPPDRA